MKKTEQMQMNKADALLAFGVLVAFVAVFASTAFCIAYPSRPLFGFAVVWGMIFIVLVFMLGEVLIQRRRMPKYD